MKIAAVVVTYNRKELLIECLDALMKQTRPLDAIYIIDNASTDGTPKLLQKKGYVESLDYNETTIKKIENNEKHINIVYVRLKENTGGAGGFYEGVKRSYEDGYDWLWLMDDDSEPLEDSLEKLLSVLDSKKNVSVLCSSVILEDGSIVSACRGHANLENIFPLIQIPIEEDLYLKDQSVEIDIASFVGILINCDKIKEVGFPKKEFFIYHDDIEYSLRLKKKGKIILVPSSKVIHKEASKKDLLETSLLGKKIYTVPFRSLWIQYYGTRNLVYLGRNYSTNKLRFYMLLFKNLILSLMANMLLRDNKYRRMKFTICSYLDGVRGVFDNEKPKRILYDCF